MTRLDDGDVVAHASSAHDLHMGGRRTTPRHLR